MIFVDIDVITVCVRERSRGSATQVRYAEAHVVPAVRPLARSSLAILYKLSVVFCEEGHIGHRTCHGHYCKFVSPVVSCHQNAVAKAVGEISNLPIRLEFQRGQDWPRVDSVLCSCLFYSDYWTFICLPDGLHNAATCARHPGDTCDGSGLALALPTKGSILAMADMRLDRAVGSFRRRQTILALSHWFVLRAYTGQGRVCLHAQKTTNSMLECNQLHLTWGSRSSSQF